MSIKRVIIVEDDNTFKEMLESYVRSLEDEFEVVGVPGISSFILEYNRNTPDVIFLDVLLPGISGIEILKFLKKLGCSSKIYLMSGFSGAMKNSPVEPDGFLEKPFDLEKIGNLLKQL